MSVDNSKPGSSSRPAVITRLALAICAIALGQILCAGLMPDVNAVGIGSGLILFAAGLGLWTIKGLWHKESIKAYLNFLTGALFLIIALNGALGLGLAQFRSPLIFAWLFVAVGVVFFVLGWLSLKAQSRK